MALPSKQNNISALYEEYCFLAREACELSPALFGLDDFIGSANKALQAGNLRALRLGKLTMLDWVRHLDEPNKTMVCEKFCEKFGYNLKELSSNRVKGN